jgi:hypothetical protein
MDHEVSMAQNSLEAIAKAAIELSQKIGSVDVISQDGFKII